MIKPSIGPSVPVLSTLEMLQMQLGEGFAELSESDINSALAFDIGVRERDEAFREMERSACGVLSCAEVVWRALLIDTAYSVAGAIPGPRLNEELLQIKTGAILEVAIDAGVLRAVGRDVYHKFPPPEKIGVMAVCVETMSKAVSEMLARTDADADELWNDSYAGAFPPIAHVQTFPPPRRSPEEIGAIAVCVEVARKAVSALMGKIDAKIDERARELMGLGAEINERAGNYE